MRCTCVLNIFLFPLSSWGPLEAKINVFAVWVKMTERGWFERDHKRLRQTINWGCRSRFSFAWWKGSLGACFGPKWPTLAHLEHPEKVPSFTKEAERGWKSGARSLSWKSGWKPSTIREFWRQRICGSFFRLEVTAVWKKSAGIKKSAIVRLCFC